MQEHQEAKHESQPQYSTGPTEPWAVVEQGVRLGGGRGEGGGPGANRGGTLGGLGRRWASFGRGGGGRSTGGGGGPAPRPGWGRRGNASTTGPHEAPPGALRKKRESEEEEEQDKRHETIGDKRGREGRTEVHYKMRGNKEISGACVCVKEAASSSSWPHIRRRSRKPRQQKPLRAANKSSSKKTNHIALLLRSTSIYLN